MVMSQPRRFRSITTAALICAVFVTAWIDDPEGEGLSKRGAVSLRSVSTAPSLTRITVQLNGRAPRTSFQKAMSGPHNFLGAISIMISGRVVPFSSESPQTAYSQLVTGRSPPLAFC